MIAEASNICRFLNWSESVCRNATVHRAPIGSFRSGICLIPVSYRDFRYDTGNNGHRLQAFNPRVVGAGRRKRPVSAVVVGFWPNRTSMCPSLEPRRESKKP